MGSLPSRPCDCGAALTGRPAATGPVGVAANSGFDPPLRGEKAFYVTALRTFSRNALSKSLGSQAHITGEREQACVTCC